VAPAAAPAGDGADQALPPDGEFAAAAPRKRRRRRKPRTGGEAGSSVAAE
jgi:poly(A) polymerase